MALNDSNSYQISLGKLRLYTSIKEDKLKMSDKDESEDTWNNNLNLVFNNYGSGFRICSQGKALKLND